MPAPAPKYFKAWIIFFAIATIGGALLGGIAGGLIGVVLGLAQVDLNVIKIAGGAAGFVISLPLSYFTFRWTVSEFIVKELTAPPPDPATPPAEPPRV